MSAASLGFVTGGQLKVTAAERPRRVGAAGQGDARARCRRPGAGAAPHAARARREGGRAAAPTRDAPRRPPRPLAGARFDGPARRATAGPSPAPVALPASARARRSRTTVGMPPSDRDHRQRPATVVGLRLAGLAQGSLPPQPVPATRAACAHGRRSRRGSSRPAAGRRDPGAALDQLLQPAAKRARGRRRSVVVQAERQAEGAPGPHPLPLGRRTTPACGRCRPW